MMTMNDMLCYQTCVCESFRDCAFVLVRMCMMFIEFVFTQCVRETSFTKLYAPILLKNNILHVFIRDILTNVSTEEIV